MDGKKELRKTMLKAQEALPEDYTARAGAAIQKKALALPQYQRAAVVTYVADNHLDIEAYQEFGWEPVSVIN